MEAKSNLNAADASRVNADVDAMYAAVDAMYAAVNAMYPAIKLLAKLGNEGFKACAALQNGTESLLAFIKLQTRALAAANAQIEQLANEIATAMEDVMMSDNSIFKTIELPFGDEQE